MVINEQQTEYDDRIKEALGVEQIPICQTPLEIGKDFNLSGKDAEIWKKLFGVKPIAARTGKQTAGSGNGELGIGGGQGGKRQKSCQKRPFHSFTAFNTRMA